MYTSFTPVSLALQSICQSGNTSQLTGNFLLSSFPWSLWNYYILHDCVGQFSLFLAHCLQLSHTHTHSLSHTHTYIYETHKWYVSYIIYINLLQVEFALKWLQQFVPSSYQLPQEAKAAWEWEGGGSAGLPHRSLTPARGSAAQMNNEHLSGFSVFTVNAYFAASINAGRPS